jgi:hypothetical protein
VAASVDYVAAKARGSSTFLQIDCASEIWVLPVNASVKNRDADSSPCGGIVWKSQMCANLIHSILRIGEQMQSIKQKERSV